MPKLTRSIEQNRPPCSHDPVLNSMLSCVFCQSNYVGQSSDRWHCEQVELCFSCSLWWEWNPPDRNLYNRNDSISDHRLLEEVNISVARVAEIFCKCRLVIEAAGRDWLVGCGVVAASEASECPTLACGEIKHNRPHKGEMLNFAFSLALRNSVCPSRYSEETV